MRTNRWFFTAASLCLVLLLWGCGKEQFDPARAAEHYTGRDFSAQYTVTTHGTLYTQYRLYCEQADGISRVTILEPESVAGISALLQEGALRLQYEELSLDALLPEVAGYAPMDVLHGLLEDLRTAAPESHSLEQNRLTLEYRRTLPDGTAARKLLTLHPETLDLQEAECYLDDSLVLALEMERLQWAGPQTP